MAAVDAELARRLAEELRGDGEFRLLSRYWTGCLRLTLGETALELVMSEGQLSGLSCGPAPTAPCGDGPGQISLTGPWSLWDQMLAPVPPPFLNDVAPAQALGLSFHGHRETYFQYYPALRRVIELIRCLQPDMTP